MFKRLREARKFLGLNQTEFAEKIGITQAAYSAIESGSTPFSDKRVKAICAIFDISEKWLRTGEGDILDSSYYISKIKDISKDLTEESQKYLLIMAENLLRLQKNFISSKD